MIRPQERKNRQHFAVGFFFAVGRNGRSFLPFGFVAGLLLRRGAVRALLVASGFFVASGGAAFLVAVALFAAVLLAGGFLAAIFLAAAFVMIVIIAREEQKARTKRYEELMMDYPGLIMKFTLLVQAGMTVRNTFRKMASDYKNKNEKRIAYEELVTACHEMESGISEMEAYRRFGERCGHVKYKTFATLLIQNLQKGSRHMGEMLEKESVEAWDDRKRKAKVQGEAATTKLLFPMILMLGVVMAIVMLPACLSFYG